MDQLDRDLLESARADLAAGRADVAPWRRQLDRTLVGAGDSFAHWSIAHWLLMANLAMALALAGAVAAPALRALGLDWPASAIYLYYRLLCLQRPTHSYFVLGYQIALEQRMLAMFAAQLVAGLCFGLLRRRVGRLPGRLMILLTLPLLWDGLSQTVGLRDSDWLIRTWTGGLFNVAFVFWLYPVLNRALKAAP